jgi:hypothetical protein
MLTPSTAQADQIPNIIVTTASGSVSFFAESTTGGLYSPDASIYTDVGVGVLTSHALAGTPFPSSYLQFTIPPFNPSLLSVLDGSVTVGGQSYRVIYDGIADVYLQASLTVPAGYLSVRLPAVFAGGGTACLDIAGIYSCSNPPPPEVPDIVANLSFDVPGILTVNFSPAPPQAGPNVELFDAVFTPGPFTPVPEPSSALLVLFALTAAAIWRLYGQPATEMKHHP